MGFFNYTDKFEYDTNGFFIPHKNNKIISFDEYENTEDKIKFRNFPNQSLLTVSLKSKDNTKYVYKISIIEEEPSSEFVADGTVEILYDSSGINEIIVNGVKDGLLRDKYNDSFNITPEHYIHILYKS